MTDWQRSWRAGGVLFLALIVVSFFVYGKQPKLGASPAELVSFFHGDRTRILIATIIFCFAFLELLWFGVAGTMPPVASALADLAYVLTVLLFFPTAMFVMSEAFGLWRAQIISSRFFGVGVATVILTLLGGTTWARDGFWAPDGGYSTIAQLVAYLWIAVISGVLYIRSPATATVPERAAVPTS